MPVKYHLIIHQAEKETHVHKRLFRVDHKINLNLHAYKCEESAVNKATYFPRPDWPLASSVKLFRKNNFQFILPGKCSNKT